MTLVGRIPSYSLKIVARVYPRFVRNASGRFVSRYFPVKIMYNLALMHQDMASSTIGMWWREEKVIPIFPSALLALAQDCPYQASSDTHCGGNERGSVVPCKHFGKLFLLPKG